jgi:hypothetical protein
MKFVSKFQLELPLAWQGCVAPGCDILLGLRLLFFPLDNLETLIILAVIFVVMILAANRNSLACRAV